MKADDLKLDDPILTLDKARFLFFNGEPPIGREPFRKQLRRMGIEPFAIGHRHFITMSDLEEFKARCQENRREPAFTYAEGKVVRGSGSSSTVTRSSLQAALRDSVKRLKQL